MARRSARQTRSGLRQGLTRYRRARNQRAARGAALRRWSSRRFHGRRRFMRQARRRLPADIISHILSML